MGFTEGGNNWIGYVIHHAPGPMLAVQPTVELAKRFSRQRIDPLIAGKPGAARTGQARPLARRRQHGAVEGVPGGPARHHRREQRRRPALHAGALPLPGRGRDLVAGLNLVNRLIILRPVSLGASNDHDVRGGRVDTLDKRSFARFQSQAALNQRSRTFFTSDDSSPPPGGRDIGDFGARSLGSPNPFLAPA